jgi:hypothetical protein
MTTPDQPWYGPDPTPVGPLEPPEYPRFAYGPLPDSYVQALALGKAPVRLDPRTLRYAKYVTKASLENIPAAVNWNPNSKGFGLLGNGNEGDCVEAEYCNYLGYVGLDAGHPFTPTAAEALAAYKVLSAPGGGTDMLTANNYWRKTGIAGLKLFSYAAINTTDTIEFRHAVAVTGPAAIGIQLPLSAQTQTGPGETWTVGSGSQSVAGSWGGHCVAVTGYTTRSVLIETWGFTQLMDWDFFLTYVDEGYAYLSKPWIQKDGYSPSGLHWGQLLADMAQL